MNYKGQYRLIETSLLKQNNKSNKTKIKNSKILVNKFRA